MDKQVRVGTLQVWHLCCTVKGCSFDTVIPERASAHDLVHDPSGNRHTTFVVKPCIFIKDKCTE